MKKDICQTSHGAVSTTDSQGDGRPVVLIHGNSLSSESYEHQLSSELGRRWRLIAFDLPGHGESPPAADPSRTYRLDGYAEVLREITEHLGLARPILVGHSLGGHIAMEAVGAGLDVGGLFVFGAPPLRNPPDFAAAFLAPIAEGPSFRARLREEEIDRLAGAFMPPGVRPPPCYARSIAATDPAAREWLGRDVRHGHHHDERDVVAALNSHAAMAHGEHDQLVSRSYIEGLGLTACWRGCMQIIPGAGHCPEHDSPEEFNQTLYSFLTELAP